MKTIQQDVSLYVQNLHFVLPRLFCLFCEKGEKKLRNSFFNYNHKNFYTDFESNLLNKGK